MKLELATQNDFEAVIAFYDDVMERAPGTAKCLEITEKDKQKSRKAIERLNYLIWR